jgi:hypothetical protein
MILDALNEVVTKKPAFDSFAASFIVLGDLQTLQSDTQVRKPFVPTQDHSDLVSSPWRVRFSLPPL